ncbi:MAG: hypothetical protein RLZZ408_1848 [Verrucomicrobiota bacterium]|jgi:hypothetical protein
MPSETLHLHYRRDYRQNRRRPKHPILQAIVRLTLLIVALGIVIGILMRLGFIQEPEREIYVATGFLTSPVSYHSQYFYPTIHTHASGA